MDNELHNSDDECELVTIQEDPALSRFRVARAILAELQLGEKIAELEARGLTIPKQLEPYRLGGVSK